MTAPRTGKILLLTRYFPPPDGGAQRRYANLCRYFPPESIEVCTARGDPRREFDRSQSYPIHRMPVEPFREKNPYGFAVWTAWALGRAARRDVGIMWIGNLRRIGRIAWIVKRLTGVPYGISFYGLDVISVRNRPPRGWKGNVARRVFDEASFFLANSGYIASLAREYAALLGARPPGERLHVIHSGADLERFGSHLDPVRCRAQLGLQRGPIVYTVARLIRQKGIATALRAFARVAHAHPEATYVIAGSGDQEDVLRQLAADLGIARQVRFLGRVPYERIPTLHAAADIFLLTSRSTPDWTENFPNACLEAMAAGRPVVASRVGGVPEMVVDGETGFLVDPEEPTAVAAALGRLLEDRALCERMGRAGRARVEREFSHADVARKFYAVISRASRLPLPSWSEGSRDGEVATADRLVASTRP